MSIVGYDDIEIMSELPVPVTTVRVLSDEVGRRAARCIVARVEGREDAMDFECGAEIIVRASSGPVPAQTPAIKNFRKKSGPVNK
jgi:LacI family transcriptional regulator